MATDTDEYSNAEEENVSAGSYSSSYLKYPWLEKTKEGFHCKYCVEYFKNKKGYWITEKICLALSRKIGEKTKKHSCSNNHLLAFQALESKKLTASSSRGTVSQQVNKQSAEQEFNNKTVIKDYFLLAYYLFHNEIPHTKNWSSLISIASKVDHSHLIEKTVQSWGKNATYLSKFFITEILESFSEQQLTESKWNILKKLIDLLLWLTNRQI